MKTRVRVRFAFRVRVRVRRSLRVLGLGLGLGLGVGGSLSRFHLDEAAMPEGEGAEEIEKEQEKLCPLGGGTSGAGEAAEGGRGVPEG